METTKTKTLLVSGNTLQEWNIEEILTNEPKGKSVKEMFSDMQYELKLYSQSRKEMYENYYLDLELRKRI